MIRRLLPLACILALAVTAWAETPKAVVSGPTTVAPGQTIFLDAAGSASDEPIVWSANPPKVKISRLTVEDEVAGGFAIVRDAPAGTYIFTATAIGTPEGKRITASTASVLVTIRGDTPPPKPDPVDPVVDPDTDPDIVILDSPGRMAAAPIPGDSHLYLSFVYDPATLTPALASLKLDESLGFALASMNAHLRSYGVDEPELAQYRLLPAAREYGVPCVLMQRPDGKVVAVVKNPTSDKILKAIRKLRKGIK